VIDTIYKYGNSASNISAQLGGGGVTPRPLPIRSAKDPLHQRCHLYVLSSHREVNLGWSKVLLINLITAVGVVG
jgi:hypothetical protein